MKLKKKILVLTLASTIALTVIGCNKKEEVKETNENTSKVESVNLDNLNNYEDVKNAYDQNIEKIMNKEQLRELDMMNIKLDDVLDYAKKASEISSNVEGSSDKIDTIDKLVALNDLENNTTQETMEETLKYIISEFESNNLNNTNKILEYQYVVRFLDKRLQNHPNMSIASDMIEDMNQICKDNIRNDNSRMDANISQVNKNISIVKSSL
ncbi:MAG: hypothetical protein ACRDDM_02635 [Paraclostridium sp.]